MTTTPYTLTVSALAAREAAEIADEARAEMFGENETDPENRRFVDYSDVLDPEAAVTRYGLDDAGRWHYVPASLDYQF